MHRHHPSRPRRRPLRAAAATLLLLLAVALPRPGLAQDGAAGMGTRYFQCREEALTTYEFCKASAEGLVEKAKCYIAWDLDNIGCDLDLMENFLPLLGKGEE